MSVARRSLGCVAVLVLASAVAAEEQAAYLWKEGEDFAEAPVKEAKVAGEKLCASGTRVLWGMAMDKKGLVVRYEGNLAQAAPKSRLIFRYARQHWKADMVPVAMPLEMTAGGKTVERIVTFDQTGGWGNVPGEWGLASLDLGDLPAGKWSIQFTSPADDSDICLDGFWIAPPGFRVAAGEFTPLLRMRVGADGYLGWKAPTTAVDQKARKGLVVVARDFAGPPGAVKATLTDSSGKTIFLGLAESNAEGTAGAKRWVFVGLLGAGDGLHTLKLTCDKPELTLETEVVLMGELLVDLDARVKRLAAVAKDLPGKDAAAQASRGDLDYAVEYLTAAGMELRTYASPPEPSAAKNAWQLRPRDPAVVFENTRDMVLQYWEAIPLLLAGKDPYAGRTGDLRRAFASKSMGIPIHTRLYIPTNYAKAEKVPLILTLHGSGGNEDGMANVDRGKIFELAEKRGYLMVCPAYSTDRDGNYMGGLLDVIAAVRAAYPKVDPARIYCTGFSMGGFASAQLAAFHGELFAAVSCQGGAGRPEWAEKIKIPVQVVQGGADPIVKPEFTAKAVDAMKAADVNPEVHIIPFANHEYLAAQYMGLAMDYFDKHAKK